MMVYSGKGAIDIYINSEGEFLLKQADYFESIRFKTSLLRLLPQFELSVENVHKRIIIDHYKIEDILPFNELILFLIKEMKSSYWVNLVCSFLLNERIRFKLSTDALNCLRNKELTYWLPQKETHLVWKLLSKNSRL